jgi:hypothetical protein
MGSVAAARVKVSFFKSNIMDIAFAAEHHETKGRVSATRQLRLSFATPAGDHSTEPLPFFNCLGACAGAARRL